MEKRLFRLKTDYYFFKNEKKERRKGFYWVRLGKKIVYIKCLSFRIFFYANYTYKCTKINYFALYFTDPYITYICKAPPTN